MSNEHTTHACPTCGDVHLPPDDGPQTADAENIRPAREWPDVGYDGEKSPM